jgi:hypothetical protein
MEWIGIGKLILPLLCLAPFSSAFLFLSLSFHASGSFLNWPGPGREKTDMLSPG